MGPLKYRNFRLLWSAVVLQGIASWVQQIAISWLILEMTDSPFLLGLNSFFNGAPYLFSALYGGAIADRLDRRKVLLVMQGGTFLFALLPGYLASNDLVQLWHLYALSAITSILAGFDGPARTSLVPNLLPREELMRGVALMSVIRRGSALVGPMIGGTAIAVSGEGGAFYCQAVFNGLAMLLTITMVTPPSEARATNRSMAGSILDGLKLARQNLLIWGMLSVEAVAQFTILYVQIVPVFARDVLHVGPQGLGLLYAAPGVGALLGSATMVTLGNVRAKGRIFAVAALTKPAAVMVFALSTFFPLSMLMLGLVGFIDVVGGTARSTMLQLITPDRYRGRIMSLDSITLRGMGTLSGVPLGSAASLIGAPLALAAGATITGIYVVSQLVRVPSILAYRDADQGTPGSVPRPVSTMS